MSSNPPYSQPPYPSTTSFSPTTYTQSNSSRASLDTVNSYTPLSNTRRPQKDWEAAFGQLQSRYGTGGLPPGPEKKEKRPKTSDGDKPRSKSFSALLPSGRRRAGRQPQAHTNEGRTLDAVQEEQQQPQQAAGGGVESERSLDPRKVRSATYPSEPSTSGSSIPTDVSRTITEGKKSRFAVMKSFMARGGGGRKGSRKGGDESEEEDGEK